MLSKSKVRNPPNTPLIPGPHWPLTPTGPATAPWKMQQLALIFLELEQVSYDIK